MPLMGQASGGWTESSSALRVLHVGVRNSLGVLTADSFTQANPAVDPVAGTTTSQQVDTTLVGVLSGSVAFVRPDAGSNFIGGPGDAATQAALAGNNAQAIGYRALGVFMNAANGNAFENTPATASGKNTYVSSQGTHANGLFETQLQNAIGADAQGAALTYISGMRLMASRSGFLVPRRIVDGAAAFQALDAVAAESAEGTVHAAGLGAAAVTTIGVLKMAPDATQNELVYDQRI